MWVSAVQGINIEKLPVHGRHTPPWNMPHGLSALMSYLEQLQASVEQFAGGGTLVTLPGVGVTVAVAHVRLLGSNVAAPRTMPIRTQIDLIVAGASQFACEPYR